MGIAIPGEDPDARTELRGSTLAIWLDGGGSIGRFFGRFSGFRAEPARLTHLLAWSIACLGAVTASAGLSVQRLDMARAGTIIWCAAVALHAFAIFRRYSPNPTR